MPKMHEFSFQVAGDYDQLLEQFNALISAAVDVRVAQKRLTTPQYKLREKQEALDSVLGRHLIDKTIIATPLGGT